MRRRTASHVLVVAAAALSLTAGPVGDAFAYVRTTTTDGKGLAWPDSCTLMIPDAAFTPDVPASPPALSAFTAIQSSAQAWRTASQSCGYFHIEVGAPEANLEVRCDGRNIIIWRESRWCRPAVHNQCNDKDDQERCYDSNAAAITTVFYIDDTRSSRNGMILDTDIEVNGVNFSWGTGGEKGKTDIANTMTHELGHVLGLDHTCWDGQNPKTRPHDGNGDPVPDCGGQLPEEITEATMYAYASPSETSKRTPKADDVAGVCAIYPLASDPHYCEPTGEGTGCSVAGWRRAGAAHDPGHGGGYRSPLLLLGCALLLPPLLLGRRRRRPCP